MRRTVTQSLQTHPLTAVADYPLGLICVLIKNPYVVVELKVNSARLENDQTRFKSKLLFSIEFSYTKWFVQEKVNKVEKVTSKPPDGQV